MSDTTPIPAASERFSEAEIRNAWRARPRQAVTGADRAIEFVRFLEARAALSHPSTPQGWQVVPVEPTPEIIAAAAIAVWPTASAADIALARKAAPIVLMQSDLGPGFTVDSLADALAAMAPAYRAMVKASAPPSVQERPAA